MKDLTTLIEERTLDMEAIRNHMKDMSGDALRTLDVAVENEKQRRRNYVVDEA